MNFRSDNEAPAAPEIMAALARANHGAAHSYGADAITKQLQARFSELFDTEVAVFPVATGTAANALSLAELAPPYGAVFCHESIQCSDSSFVRIQSLIQYCVSFFLFC